nr:uncharacterized protein LOC112701688 [Arachis hypogaea]
MESIGVLVPHPTFPYLEHHLQARFNLLRDRTKHAASIRAVVVNSVDGADAKLIDALPMLEIVSCYGVGVDKVDLRKCAERGIRVTNTPDVITDETADVAMALIISLLRRLCQCDVFVRSGKWKHQGSYPLTTKFSGKTVGILGLGRIGKAVAKRAEAFNCKICYHSRTVKTECSSYKYYPSVVDLASNCDILVVACSLTIETHHIINRDVMNALGPKGVLINVGRGKHVDEAELVSALLEGRLGGAGLDVFHDEPHVPPELFELDNVVLLPHIGSATVETRTAMADLVLANLEAHFLAKPLATPVLLILVSESRLSAIYWLRRGTKPLSLSPSTMEVARMESMGVVMTNQMHPYLEEQLAKRFNLFRLWNYPSLAAFSKAHSNSIRALVGNTKLGADATMIDSLPKLEIVCTYSVGLDKIDLPKCKQRGIRVANTPDVLTDDVADLAIALALSVSRRICACDSFVRNHSWSKSDFYLTSKFSGKTVGIVGLGRIGSAIAKRAAAFGCPVSYHSRSEKPDTGYKFYSNILDLAANSQILIVACALTQETHHIVNRKVIDALGPKGILINIGRGQHVDEAELVSALTEGRLAGAGLDVYENEPHVPEELLRLDNVVLVPHIGSDTVETCDAMADLVIANLEAHFQNKPLLTPVT